MMRFTKQAINFVMVSMMVVVYIIVGCIASGNIATAQTVYLRPMNDANNCLVAGTSNGNPDTITCYSAVPFISGDRVLCANLTGDTAPNRDDLKVGTVVGNTFTITTQSGTPIPGTGVWRNGDFGQLSGNAQICGKVQPYTLKTRPFLWTDSTGRSGIEMAAKIDNGLLTSITVSGGIPTVHYAVSIAGTGITTCTSCFGIFGSGTAALNASNYNITAVSSNSVTLSATAAGNGTYTDSHLTASAWAYSGNLWWDALNTVSWRNRWLNNGTPASPIGLLPNYWGLEGAAILCYVNELDTNACNTAKWAVTNFEFVTSSGSFGLYETITDMINTLDFGTRFGGDIARSYELLLSIPGMLSAGDKTAFANKVLNSYIPAGETCTQPLSVNKTGTISITAGVVTGTGTNFLTDLVDGDILRTQENGYRDPACQVYNMAGATNTHATCYPGSYGPPAAGTYSVSHKFANPQCGFTIFTAHKNGGATWPGQPVDQPPAGGYVSSPFTNQMWPRVGGLMQLGLVTCPEDTRGCYLFEATQAFFADYMLPSEFSLMTGTMGCGPNYDYSVCMWGMHQDALVLKNAVVSGPDWAGNDGLKWFGDWTRYHHVPGLPAPIDSTFGWNAAYQQMYGGGGQPINGYDPNADGWDFGQSFASWLALDPTSTTTKKYQYWLRHDWPNYNISVMGGPGYSAGFSFETSFPTIPEINYHATDPLGILFKPTTNQLQSCLNQGTQTSWQFPCTKNFSYNHVVSKTGWDLTSTSPDTLLTFSGEASSVERSGNRFMEWYLFKGDELVGSEDTAVNNIAGQDLSSSNGTSNPCTIHSASYAFSAIDVGMVFRIVSSVSPGPNWTTSTTTITSTSGGNAVVPVACGTVASLSGGFWSEALVLRGQRNNRGNGDYGNSRYNQFQIGAYADQSQVDGNALMSFYHGQTVSYPSYGFTQPNFDRFLTSDTSGHVFTYSHLDCTTCLRSAALVNRLTREVAHMKNGAETIGIYTYIDTTSGPTTILGDFVNYQQNGQTTEGNTTCTGGCATLTTNKEILSLSTKSGVHSKFVPVGNSLVFMEYPTDGSYSANGENDRFTGTGVRNVLNPIDTCAALNTLCWNVSAKGNGFQYPPKFVLAPRGASGVPLTSGEFGVDTGKDYYWTQGSKTIHQDLTVGSPLRTTVHGTDLATTNGTAINCTITSASYTFTSLDVGTQVILAGGGGWTNIAPFVDSVSSGAATLHGACGSSNVLTGGVFDMLADVLNVQYNMLSTGYSGGNVSHVAGCAGTGTTCDPAATKYEMIQVHRPFYGTSDPGLTVSAINPDSNWAGVQTSDKIMMFARGGTSHVTMTSFTPTNNGTSNYLFGGLVTGTYNISVGGTPVTGSPFTVIDGVNSVEFSAPTNGLVALSGTAAGCTITSTSPLTGGTVGVFYTFTFATSACTNPVTWSITAGSLPNGLTLHTTTGVIDGTPTVPNPFSFTATIVDALTTGGSLPSTITIGGAAPVCTITSSGALAGGVIGSSYSQGISTSGCTPQPPTSNWTIASGSLCPGLSINPGTGVISGTPTGSPTLCTFTVQVIDSVPNTAVSPTLTITVTNPTGSLTVSPTLLTFSCTTTSNPPNQSIVIGSSGPTLDQWAAGNVQTFTTLTPQNNTVASAMVVSINCIGLSTGSHTDFITVSSTTAGVTGNNPVTIPVTVNVLGVPLPAIGNSKIPAAKGVIKH